MTNSANSDARDGHLQALSGFFKQHVPAVETITEATPLLGSGWLDSLAVVQLMMFLGTEFNIEIEDEDFVPENLADVASLLNFIVRKQSSA